MIYSINSQLDHWYLEVILNMNSYWERNYTLKWKTWDVNRKKKCKLMSSTGTAWSQVLGNMLSVSWEAVMQTRVGSIHDYKHVKSRKRELCNNSLHSMSRNTTQLLSNSGPIRKWNPVWFAFFSFFVLVSDFANASTFCISSWNTYISLPCSPDYVIHPFGGTLLTFLQRMKFRSPRGQITAGHWRFSLLIRLCSLIPQQVPVH